MSRAGRLHLTQVHAPSAFSQLVSDVIGELGPAANQAISFYLDGLADLLTMPVEAAAEPVMTEVRTAGAHQIEVETGDMRREYEAVRSAVIAAAAEREIDLPHALAVKPAFVSRSMLKSEQAALDAVRGGDSREPGTRDRLRQFAAAIEHEQATVQRAFDDASLVAGRAAQGGTQAVFGRFRDFLEATDANGAGPVAAVLQEWADGVRRDIRTETEEAWTLAALAVSKVALETGGFAECVVDVDQRQIRAQDQSSEAGEIVVSADPGQGQIGYELIGYVGEACAEPEQRFLSALASVLGTDLTAENLRHWRTEEAAAPDLPVPEVPAEQQETAHRRGERSRSTPETDRDRGRLIQ